MVDITRGTEGPFQGAYWLKKERGAVVYFFVVVDMYYTRSPSGDILRDLTDHRSKGREGRLVFTWQLLNAVSQSRKYQAFTFGKPAF